MKTLPTGWKETKLGNLVELAQGVAINVKTNHVLCDKSEGLPLLKINNLLNDTVDLYANPKLVPPKTILKKEDLVFTRTGQVGFVFTNKIGILHNNSFKVIPSEELNKDFLYWFLKQDSVYNYVQKVASGSVQLDLNHDAFKTISINYPIDIEEQKEIANILSSLDKKINLLKEQNQTLETMAQTIFKEWFVDFNYPNATGEMIDSEMGEIPKGWEIIQISNLFDVRDGTHDSPKQTLSGKYLITSKHILNFKLDMENAYLISEEDFLNINKRSLVEENDILFSMIGTIGLTYLEQSSNINYAIKNVALFKTSQNIEWVYYMYIWLSGGKGQDFILKHKTGSTQQYISLSSLRNIKIIKPSSEILIYFNNFVRPIFNKIKINTSQIQTLEETRDSLLPKLMSGQKRVFEYDN